MTTYTAENIETGEIVEGAARDVARTLGVAHGYIMNAVSKGKKVKRVWYITKDGATNKTIYSIPISTQEDWEKVTAPYKELIAKRNKRKNKIARTRLRTMYNVGIY